MSKPRSVRSLLSDRKGGLERLLDRAHRLNELDKRVRAQLPASLAVRCRVANIRAGTLILQTDSAAVHGKLRFLLPQLTRRLREEPGLADLKDIELRVAPAAETSSGSLGRRARISAESARLLESSADATDDPALRRVLQRLAGRRKV